MMVRLKMTGQHTLLRPFCLTFYSVSDLLYSQSILFNSIYKCNHFQPLVCYLVIHLRAYENELVTAQKLIGNLCSNENEVWIGVKVAII